MTDLSAIQGWLSNVQSTMAGLPAQVEQAAQTGDFAAVFSEAQSVLASTPGSQAASTTSTATASGSSTASTASTAPTSSLLSASGAGSTTSGETVVATAEKYAGVPYVWGGTTPAGFDCSGFTQYVYAQLGIELPRTSEQQATAGVAVASLADAQPGDLVFFAGSDGTASSPGHVGIYVGNGEMIDAPETGSTVSIQPVGDPVAIRRIVTGSALGATAASAGSVGPAASAGSVGPAASAGSVGPVASAGSAGSTAGALSAGSTTGATTVLTDASSAPGATGSTSTVSPEAAATAPGTAIAPAVSPSVSVPSTLAPLFESAAAQYGVPVTLLAAVAQVESGYDPTAVSSAGAEGLMQLMPSTAAGLGVDPLDPTQAIDGAAQLLSGYLAQYHSVPEALAAYNVGPAAVAEYGGVPPYTQTQDYVQAVMQIAGGSS